MLVRRTAAVLCLVPLICSAQAISVGVKIGATPADDLRGEFSHESKRYVVGPYVEFRLLPKLAVEADALYRRVGYSTYQSYGIGVNSQVFRRVRANSWEIPVLMKYQLPAGFSLAGGATPRNISGSETYSVWTTRLFGTGTTHSESKTDPRYGWSVGPTVAAGFHFSKGPVTLTPEFRFTRWNNTPVQTLGPSGPIRSTQNQFDVLLGIGRHK